jgi:alkanesulfonate monooxygenase
VITGLWNTPHGEKFSYNGTHYTVEDSPALPKPVQSPPPIIVGGGGPRRTPRLAAMYAAEFNLPFSSADAFVAQRDRVRSACDTLQRDPDSLIYSVAQVVCVGSTSTEIARRAVQIGREVEELRQNGICGTPDEVIEKISSWATTGASRMYLQVLDLDDLDHLSLIGETVLPHVK